ncbi:various chains-domain-containing protein [Tuber indicum]|nr:various chains-domain-containing protein [Tuber indicum]
MAAALMYSKDHFTIAGLDKIVNIKKGMNQLRQMSTGLTYFLLGGLSSCFILLGSCLLYLNFGITNLDGLYVLSSLSEVNGLEVLVETNQYFNLALLIMSVGYLFKVSAAPFHLVHYTSQSMFDSFLSLIIGSVVGLVQHRIKRLLAYSTISHVGFLLLALVINSTESVQAFLFYLMQYSLSNINVFFILIIIGYYLLEISRNADRRLLEINNSPVQLISQFQGFFFINPFLAISLAITLFSFAGLPPLIGFFAKQQVLSAALNQVGILTSVVSAVYYLRIIKLVFFDKNESIAYNKYSYYFASSSPFLTITISVLTLIILLFIFSPTE